MSKAVLEEFLAAWQSGKVCLHPTDTLPGLSFDPRQKKAWQSLLAIKERPPEKSPIALVATFEQAAANWAPLPGSWSQILGALWPGPLSVIWEANATCPEYLRAADGTVALRCPQLSDAWMREALLKLECPFPTSSVNRSGEAASRTWAEACHWALQFPALHVPPLSSDERGKSESKPSTLLRIIDARRWEILREGALDRSTIVEEFARHERNI